MNAPISPRLDFAGISYDEAVARAHALVPVLKERAACWASDQTWREVR
jgi:hypothetical protein